MCGWLRSEKSPALRLRSGLSLLQHANKFRQIAVFCRQKRSLWGTLVAKGCEMRECK